MIRALLDTNVILDVLLAHRTNRNHIIANMAGA